ncbi:hypothetical protein [Swingsia samuiensis]|uniref:Uncharacterized protein n=1 Tax=Swingsia samuiensis TaxID=1293412 RepID=A0A4Y6UIX2_9PROT|nr:hypothetical protein [Swingsia samuiensis]QDH16770.1 hypothetical protein E3D00_03705 [Swingsia samuiensis]
MIHPLLEDVLLDASPVTELYPDWEPKSRHPVVDHFEAIVFEETASHRQACWWLENNRYIGSHIIVLPKETQNRLLVSMDKFFWAIAEGILKGNTNPEEKRFFSDETPQIVSRELAATWLHRHAPHTVFVDIKNIDNSKSFTCPDGKVLVEGRLPALFASKRFSLGSNLVVSSPFSAMPLRSQIEMKLDSTITAYRFYDDMEDVVFYLLWDESEPNQPPSFYYPQGPLLISEPDIGPLLPGWILEWYNRHPEHENLIETARPFLPEDYGVGRASSMRLRQPTPQESKPNHPQDASNSSEPPPQPSEEQQASPIFTHFLKSHTINDLTQTDNSSKKGLIGRFKSLLGKKE